MGYESPIDMIYGQMRIETENAICKAVQEVGINVDKEELIKALQYDREQYQKGYKDGYVHRGMEIVRCTNCCFGKLCNGGTAYVCEQCIGTPEQIIHSGGWFCANGKRRID